MTFSPKSLVRGVQVPVGSTAGVATSPMNSTFRYATADAAAVVETSGYFSAAQQFLTVGDVIEAAMVLTGTPVSKRYVVLTNPAAGPTTIGIQAVTAG